MKNNALIALGTHGIKLAQIFMASVMVLATQSYANQCYSDPVMAYQALVAKKSAVQVQNNKININTATVGELTTLAGIGAKTAQAIVDYRQAFGRFSTVDELTNVKGIGAKSIEKNRDRLVAY